MLKTLRKCLFVCGLVLLLAATAQSSQNNPDNVVYHFFSFACPHCYKHEPAFARWGNSLPTSIIFKSIPVINNNRWEIQSARAYFAALRTDAQKAETMKLAIFQLVQSHSSQFDMTLSKPYFMLAEKIKLNMDKFTQAWWSDKVRNDLVEAYNLLRKYAITNIPCLVVGGKMLIPDMTGGDWQRFFQLGNGYVSRILDGSIKQITMGGGK